MQLFHLSSFSQVLCFSSQPIPLQNKLYCDLGAHVKKLEIPIQIPSSVLTDQASIWDPPLFYFPRSFVDFSVGFFFSFHENFKCKSLIPVWNRNIFEMLATYLTGKKKTPWINTTLWKKFYFKLMFPSEGKHDGWAQIYRMCPTVSYGPLISPVCSGKWGEKPPSAPCCVRGASALAYRSSELFLPCCCKDGEIKDCSVGSILQCLCLRGVEFAF